MTQTAVNYARILYELAISDQSVKETTERLTAAPEIIETFKNPVVTRQQKHRIIERIFPAEIRNFMKVLCDHHDSALLEEILEAYHVYACEQCGILIATLRYVTLPMETQLEEIKKGLCEKYDQKQIELNLVKDPGLIGGFVISVGNTETDWSLKGRLDGLEQKLMRR